jgi:hypothetical protein
MGCLDECSQASNGLGCFFHIALTTDCPAHMLRALAHAKLSRLSQHLGIAIKFGIQILDALWSLRAGMPTDHAERPTCDERVGVAKRFRAGQT